MKEWLKTIAFRHTNIGAPRYNFNIEPIQLAEIVMGLESVLSGRGNAKVFEIGVARGMTSRFIAEHIMSQKHSCEFFCIDTFSSFTDEDVEFEVSQRGKAREDISGFSYNDFDAWRRNFLDFEFVVPVQADASKFDFSIVGAVDFLFLDVDLYKPTKAVLEHSKPYWREGAVIIVDDVMDGNRWDGAYQAFMEFVKENGLDYRIAGNRCGIVEY